MLVLTRKPGEAVVLQYPDTERITITVLENGRIGTADEHINELEYRYWYQRSITP